MGRRWLSRFLFAITVGLGALALTTTGCSSEPGAPQGDGGRTGATGGSAAGGATGAGGAAGGSTGAVGGSMAAGGQSGAGGVRADGGAADAAGMDADSGAGHDGGTGGSGGGVGGAGGNNGMGGASAYNPCPTNGDPCTILPLGDSITHGFDSTDDAGYRSQLFKLIVAANQKVTFTGSLANGPTQVSGQTFPRMHEGHDGWTIDPGFSTFGAGGISSLVPSPAFDGKPHIVLLHIGTNDTNFMDTANMSTRLESLLDKIAQASPSSLIVLAQITPLGYTSAALTAYNAKIPGIVQSHAAKGQHIVGVDMSKMPVPADIASDNVHPNDQGYVYMAGIWYAAIRNLLPK